MFITCYRQPADLTVGGKELLPEIRWDPCFARTWTCLWIPAPLLSSSPNSFLCLFWSLLSGAVGPRPPQMCYATLLGGGIAQSQSFYILENRRGLGERARRFSEEESRWVEHEWAEGSFCQAWVLLQSASMRQGPDGVWCVALPDSLSIWTCFSSPTRNNSLNFSHGGVRQSDNLHLPFLHIMWILEFAGRFYRHLFLIVPSPGEEIRICIYVFI